MNFKNGLLVFIAGLLVISSCFGVDTRRIDTVRDKGVLDSRDLTEIDRFVSDSLLEMAGTRELSEIANIRTAMVSRSGSKSRSAKIQYSEKFNESAYKHLKVAFTEAGKVEDAQISNAILVNLLIIINDLGDPDLLSLSIPMLDDSREVVRYWAVQSVSNERVIGLLNSNKAMGSKLVLRISDKLSKVIGELNPYTFRLVGEFAAGVDYPEGGKLLIRMADIRIKMYEGWNVRGELFDAELLKNLFARASGSDNMSKLMGSRFGQLYSYVIQRYVLGTGKVGQKQQAELISVMVDIERKCTSKAMDAPQAGIVRAIKGKDNQALMAEHDKILGSKTSQGELPKLMRFDYNGSKSPKVLSSVK
jgi:hypothetical protein